MYRNTAPHCNYSLCNLLNILELACGADQIFPGASLYIAAAKLHILLAQGALDRSDCYSIGIEPVLLKLNLNSLNLSTIGVYITYSLNLGKAVFYTVLCNVAELAQVTVAPHCKTHYRHGR